MFPTFRLVMAWLHTWFGLVLGLVLMVVFFFGSLSVFDREIDRWALPSTRFDPQIIPSFDRIMWPALQAMRAHEADYEDKMARLHDHRKGPMTPRLQLTAQRYSIYTTHRDPVVRIRGDYGVPLAKDPLDPESHIHGYATIDPRSGSEVRADQLKIGSEWFYPLHYSLNVHWKNLGIYVVGLAALIMLVALVSGIIIHRRLWRELFTFRPKKSIQRSTLDLHNLSGVVALPFHFFFAFTGLVIFAAYYYFPVSQFPLRTLHDQHEAIAAQQSGLPQFPAGVPAVMLSVDAMMAEAKRRWASRDMAGEIGYIVLNHVGDANGTVSIYRAGSDRVTLVGEGIHFKSSTGAVLYEDPPLEAVSALHEFMTGLHLQHFEHWLLRWLYLFGGLLGCVCIATGFLFFVHKRQQVHAQASILGCRIVEALAVTTTSGMLIATVGMLVGNRLLPDSLADKGEWEKWIFGCAWCLALLHALWQGSKLPLTQRNPAWIQQLWMIALLALIAVISNALTTGDHLVKTLVWTPYWPVAGVDLVLLVLSLCAAWSAKRLQRRWLGATATSVPSGPANPQYRHG